jgi:hypothetical protein
MNYNEDRSPSNSSNSDPAFFFIGRVVALCHGEGIIEG